MEHTIKRNNDPHQECRQSQSEREDKEENDPKWGVLILAFSNSESNKVVGEDESERGERWVKKRKEEGKSNWETRRKRTYIQFNFNSPNRVHDYHQRSSHHHP